MLFDSESKLHGLRSSGAPGGILQTHHPLPFTNPWRLRGLSEVVFKSLWGGGVPHRGPT